VLPQEIGAGLDLAFPETSDAVNGVLDLDFEELVVGAAAGELDEQG